MKKIITTTKGDDSGTIDDLIKYLEQAKEKGATHFLMRWSNDPQWAFKWFETYRIKSEDEVKQDKINELQKEINALKNDSKPKK